MPLILLDRERSNSIVLHFVRYKILDAEYVRIRSRKIHLCIVLHLARFRLRTYIRSSSGYTTPASLCRSSDQPTALSEQTIFAV